MRGKACHVPGSGRLMRCIAEDIRLMAAPVTGGDFAARLESLLAALPTAEGDLLDPPTVAAMMQAAHGGGDSLHRLVMDLHKQLNAMQAALATETLDGAATYNLHVDDRPLVAAFMAGLNRTAGLKFNHPGLATTATRAGEKLLIQNDIGTTDAHVIVIHVVGLTVSVTYTDVHVERLVFFQEMLKPRNVVWEGSQTAVLAAGSPFYMATGRFEAANAAECRGYLEFLGSRLVFLIDWNRARKQLRGFCAARTAWPCCIGRRKTRSGIAASLNLAARIWSIRPSRPPPARRCISATGCAMCWAARKHWISCASSSPHPRPACSRTNRMRSSTTASGPRWPRTSKIRNSNCCGWRATMPG